MQLLTKLTWMGCGILLTISTFYSKTPAQERQQSFEEVAFDGMRTFANVLQLVETKHYQADKPQDCINAAIKGFLTCLDPHSSFLDPKTYRRMLEATSGEFYGIGIVIDNTRSDQDRALLVIDVIPEGPADKSGLEAQDKIIEIGGKPLEGMSTEEAITMLKGEKDTTVHVKVLRESKPDLLTFDIVRDVVKEQSSLCFYLDAYNVYYLSLTTFSNNAVHQIESLLKKSKERSYRALILDLRNNSGGLLTAAVDIAGLFLPKDSLVVSTKNNKNEETSRYATTREPIANPDLPIFILINNYTASAAEILAGCLQIHSDKLSNNPMNKKPPRVFLVGSTSFGKGSVQEVIPVGSDSAVKLTTSLYFLPEDTSIQGEGISPDFQVEKGFPPTEQAKWFKKYYGREKALTNYIKKNNDANDEEETDKKETAKKKSWSERAKEALDKDNQLREALTLINLFDLATRLSPDLVANRQKAVAFLNDIHVTDKPLGLVEVTDQ